MVVVTQRRELTESLPATRPATPASLYRRYSGELFGFACNALADRQLAEEVVQDVFARAWSHAGDYDARRASVRTWLYAIARHRIVDVRRRAGARPALADRDELSEAAQRDDPFEHAVLRWQVAAALARLQPEHRELIVWPTGAA